MMDFPGHEKMLTKGYFPSLSRADTVHPLLPRQEMECVTLKLMKTGATLFLLAHCHIANVSDLGWHIKDTQ